MTDPADDDWTITPESFAAAATVVLADLFGDEPPSVEIAWIAPEPGDELGQFNVRAVDGEGFGYWIRADLCDEEDLRYTLAAHVPEYLPELTLTWGRTFPPCPGHEHPAESTWDEGAGQAWWCCPRDGRRLARVGSLRA